MAGDSMKIAGIGFRDEAVSGSLLDALARLGAADIARIALPARKRGHALCAALEARGYRLLWIADAELAAIDTPTRSPIALRHYGTGSVAEAAALVAARAHAADARLIVPRVISADRLASAALATAGETS